jgi:hypothetical protein
MSLQFNGYNQQFNAGAPLEHAMSRDERTTTTSSDAHAQGIDQRVGGWRHSAGRRQHWFTWCLSKKVPELVRTWLMTLFPESLSATIDFSMLPFAF